jgi:hypothetical protein
MEAISGETLPTLIRKTRQDLEQQRTQLLAETRLSYEELRDRAERFTLSMEELDIWYTIEGIEYLLDGEC